MRCLFLDVLTESERAGLAEFDDSCRALFEAWKNAPKTDAGTLKRQLATLDTEFELLSFASGGVGALCLDVTSSDPAARPRLQRFANLAPDGFRVQVGAGPRPLDEVSAAVERATGQSLAGARVRAGFARGHLLELVVHLAKAAGSEDEMALGAAEHAVYGLLGEQRADDWIGAIDVAPLPRGGPLRLVSAESEMEHTFPLSALEATVDSAIAGLYEGLRAQSSAPADSGEWTLLEAQPGAEGSDLAQGDLLYASTRLPEMLKCFLEGAPFSSCRFSAHGERFAYLKYVHQGDAKARAVERQALEDAVEAALDRNGVGWVVGNGIGTRHSYIDLALSDVPGALLEMRELGQAHELPRSSWLLFCDSQWRREWVGIWSDTPAP